MVLFKGDKRQFINPEVELDTSTDTERLISIYGVASYDDLDNCLIPITAYFAGAADATMNINDLGAKELYQLTAEGYETVTDSWVQEGQLYFLTYIKSNDKLVVYSFNNNSSSGEIPEDETHVTYTPYDVLSLTSESTAEEILTAFYYEDEMIALSDGIKSNHVIVFNTRFSDLPEYPEFKSAIAIDAKQTSDEDNVYDKLTVHLPELNAVKVLTFTRAQGSNVYTKAEVEDVSTDLTVINENITKMTNDIQGLNTKVTQLENSQYTPEDTGWQTVTVIVPTVNGATSNLKARVLNGVLYLSGTLRSHWFQDSDTNNKVATLPTTVANKLGSEYKYFLRPSSNNDYAIGTFYLSDGNIYLETYNTDSTDTDVYFELYDVAICI